MPKVGGKTFAYTKAGKAEAKAYAKKKGSGAMNSATCCALMAAISPWSLPMSINW